MIVHRTLTSAALAALALGALASGPVAAQSASPPSGIGDPSAPLGSPANPIKQSSPTPPSDAYRLKAGDPTVISNAPIPDTRENRARYGAPLSNGGAHTTPAGD